MSDPMALDHSSDIWKKWGDHHLKYTLNGDHEARSIFDQLEVYYT
jgi:hypothetical protein